MLDNGTLNDPGEIHWVRVTWLGYFGAMQRGGEPRCAACKNNPKYKELKARTPALSWPEVASQMEGRTESNCECPLPRPRLPPGRARTAR